MPSIAQETQCPTSPTKSLSSSPRGNPSDFTEGSTGFSKAARTEGSPPCPNQGSANSAPQPSETPVRQNRRVSDPENLRALIQAKRSQASLNKITASYLPLIQQNCKGRALSNSQSKPYWGELRSELICVLLEYLSVLDIDKLDVILEKYGSLATHLAGCLNVWYPEALWRVSHKCLDPRRKAYNYRKKVGKPQLYVNYQDDFSTIGSNTSIDKIELRDSIMSHLKKESPNNQKFLTDYLSNLPDNFTPNFFPKLGMYCKANGIAPGTGRAALNRLVEAIRIQYKEA